jgi:hypothetical protein
MTDLGPSPALAVVIPCWNAELWIARAIQSALDQDYANLEVIVIDDGSTDASLERIKAFGDKIQWRSGPNRGGCAARNIGLEMTQADWVLFLDADDYLEPGSIGAWTQVVTNDVDVVIGPFAYEQDGQRTPGRGPTDSSSSLAVFDQWIRGKFTPPCSVLWNRPFLASIGGWNTAIARNQDGELVLRAMLQGARPVLVSKGCGVYVQHSSPGRVSKRQGRTALMSELSLFRNLLDMCATLKIPDAVPALSEALYRLAYEAYANEIDDLGDDALAEARALGLKGHLGSPVHRVLAGAFGLRGKMHLTSRVRRALASLARYPPRLFT